MNIQRALAKAVVVALVGLVAACGSNKNKPDQQIEKSQAELRQEAAALYRVARQALDSSDFEAAVDRYNQLSLRYPFTEYATQGDLEKVYALARGFDADKAISAGDRFLREHPRHPSVDYIYYIKGIINSTRDQSISETLSIGDPSKGDVGNDRRAFDDFALLVQKYPDSRYASDARLRMIALRNTIADHELNIVRFYVSRGAYLAAAKRAEQVIAQYPGAPASYEALGLLESSYRDAGLPQQADEVRRLREAQPEVKLAEAVAPKRSLWDRVTGRNKEPAAVTPPPAIPAIPAATEAK